MTIYRHARVSFAAGEVADDLRWRSELASNQTGLRRARNILIRPQGGFQRRGGTEVMGYAKTPSEPSRVMPFDYSGDEALIIEWGHLTARLYDGDGQVMSGGAPYEIASPYEGQFLHALRTSQVANTQWIASSFALRELRRTQASPLAMSLVAAEILSGPFLEENTGATTLVASGVSGTVTLTASAALFEAGHAGAFWRLDEMDWSDTGQWIAAATVSAGDRVRYAERVYEAVNSGATSSNPPQHAEGEQADSTAAGAVIWRYLHEGWGVVKITSVTTPTSAEAEVVRRLPDQVAATPTTRWREGAWSDKEGGPLAVAHYDGRLYAGGTARKPFWLHVSAVQGFNDFDLGDEDDRGISRPLIGSVAAGIRWMVGGKSLMLGTDGPEWIARPAPGEASVTPSALLTQETTTEKSGAYPGVVIDNRTLFVDASGRRLLTHYYDFGTDAYDTEDLSLLAEHIMGPGVAEMVWQKRPLRTLWLRRIDGNLVAVTYHRKQDVIAWSLHHFGGFVRSIAVRAASGVDELWLQVERGAHVCTERMRLGWPHDAQPVEDDWYLDGAVQVTGAGVTQVTGLAHFEGEAVSALIDGVEYPGLIVSSGAVDLPVATQAKALVGRAFLSEARSLPFDLGEAGAAQHGERQQIPRLTMLMGDFVNGAVQVGDAGAQMLIAPRGQRVGDVKPEIFSGAFRVRPDLSSGESGELEVSVLFSSAYRATVYGWVGHYEV